MTARAIIPLAILALLALSGCTAAPGPGSSSAAAAQCAPRAVLVAGLADRYGERPVARGVTPRGALFEVFAASGGGFTVLLSGPNGLSCLVASGEAWQLLLPPPAGAPA